MSERGTLIASLVVVCVSVYMCEISYNKQHKFRSERSSNASGEADGITSL